jgi:hypothetical protein
MIGENERESAATIAAILRGMEQVARGEAIPLEEAEAILRGKHGFSAPVSGVTDGPLSGNVEKAAQKERKRHGSAVGAGSASQA